MALSDSGRIIKNAAYRHNFVIRDTAGSLVNNATSIASQYSQNGDTMADCASDAVGISNDGVYLQELTAAEMNANSVAVKVTSTEGVAHYAELIPEPCLTSGSAQSGSGTTITMAANSSSTDDIFNGAMIELVRGTAAAGQVRTVVDYVGSTKIATVDRAWTTSPSSGCVYIIHPRTGSPSAVVGYIDADIGAIVQSTAAATALRELYKGAVQEGALNDASPTASSFVGDSGLSSTDDFYNNMLLVFTSGSLASYVARITDYTGSSRTITLSAALPIVPGNGDEFSILSKVF